MDDLYELKVYREAGKGFPSATAPKEDEYHYVNAWGKVKNGVLHCCIVGGEGWFPFPDGFCPKFRGQDPAIVLGKIDRKRYKETNRVVPVKK